MLGFTVSTPGHKGNTLARNILKFALYFVWKLLVSRLCRFSAPPLGRRAALLDLVVGSMDEDPVPLQNVCGSNMLNRRRLYAQPPKISCSTIENCMLNRRKFRRDCNCQSNFHAKQPSSSLWA
ncbi:hypothetical protein PMIN06_010900 [Paraphaeosphaeria minitans]